MLKKRNMESREEEEFGQFRIFRPHIPKKLKEYVVDALNFKGIDKYSKNLK